MYSILIVGAGYAGGEIARHFQSKKQKVTALVRNPSHVENFQKDGISSIVADLTQPETLEKIPPAHFIVLCPAPDQHDAESYRKLYIEGIGNFLRSRKKQPRPFLVVYLSSTSVWREQQGGWVDESMAPDANHEKGKILIEAETQVLSSGLPSVIFRLGGIYGPGRNRLQAIRDKAWPQPAPDAYMNLIHRDDIVGAMQVIFNKAEAGTVYLGVDDEPCLRSDFYRWISSRLGVSGFEKNITGGVVGGKRCRNNRLKELGFQFAYPTVKKGYEALLEGGE